MKKKLLAFAAALSLWMYAGSVNSVGVLYIAADAMMGGDTTVTMEMGSKVNVYFWAADEDAVIFTFTSTATGVGVSDVTITEVLTFEGVADAVTTFQYATSSNRPIATLKVEMDDNGAASAMIWPAR